MADPIVSSDMSNMGALRINMKRALKHGDVVFAVSIMAILVILVLPIPTLLLDFLLTTSLALSTLILMTVLFIGRPLDFSSFPTILLVTTVFRLSLNIASTRLILVYGHQGSAAAGHVIEAFGRFIMSGSVVVGAIIFIILTIVNFVVITKGSGRIAEVSARFSLDAMPGKQMAIDADVSAGVIDEATAKKRRKDLEDESTFFGAMDGASKFVYGDAVAGMLITIINLVAGMIIGMVEQDLSFKKALETYTILTIGDGLVSQIPSLIISMAAGLLVSKAGVVGSADKAVFGQLSRHPQAMILCSILLVFMSMMPVVPAFPFLLLASAMGGCAWYAVKTSDSDKALKKEDKKATKDAADQEEGEASLMKTLHIDAIRLELGYGLLTLINYEKGNKLTDQIKALRKQLARDMGFIMPSVRIQDNMQLDTNQYVVKIKEIECGSGEVRPDMLLVMDPTGDPIMIPGEDTKEPAFQIVAKWITESYREEAIFHHLTLVDPPTVIMTHLTEIIKENIIDLFTQAETQHLLNGLADDHKKMVDDLIPAQITLATLQRVLQALLSESVSIRDLPTILEAVAEAARNSQNITLITEYVRARLARQISNAALNSQNVLSMIIISSKWDQAFSEALTTRGNETQLSLAPSKLQEFINEISRVFDQHGDEMPVLVTSPTIRPYVRSITERFRPSLKIISQKEIHQKIKIKTLGQI